MADVQLTATEGDPLDLLIWREAALGPATLPQVLLANPGLAERPVLSAGETVMLPEALTGEAPTPVRRVVQLWS